MEKKAARSIDRRGKLKEDPFSYRVTKDQKIFISWHGRQVTVLSGKRAADFIGDIMDADDDSAQLLMARATGHFKHGNE